MLVIDLDPQGNASTALGVEHRSETASVYDVIINDDPMAEHRADEPGVPALFCVPATIHLAGAEIELVSLVAREQRLAYGARDLPGGERRAVRLRASSTARPHWGCSRSTPSSRPHEVLIPIQCEYYALEGLSQLLTNIRMIEKHLNPELAVSTILLTMYDSRTNLAQQVAEEVREHFPDEVLDDGDSPLGPRSRRRRATARASSATTAIQPGRCPIARPRRRSPRRGAAEHRWHKRTGLGRGIGAFIPTDDGGRRPVDVFFPRAATKRPTETASRCSRGHGSRDLSPDDIIPNPRSPHRLRSRMSSHELVHSDPRVRRAAADRRASARRSAAVNQYELIMGERRLRAASKPGLDTIPAIIRDTADDAMLRDALLENLHRAELNPLEEASAYQQLLGTSGSPRRSSATRIGRSPSADQQHPPPARLPAAVQQRVAAGVLTRRPRARDPVARRRRVHAAARRQDRQRGPLGACRGGGGEPGSKPAEAHEAPAGQRQGHLDEVPERLGDRLDTRVKMTLGASKGAIVIDFATVGDLNRILAELGEPGFA